MSNCDQVLAVANQALLDKDSRIEDLEYELATTYHMYGDPEKLVDRIAELEAERDLFKRQLSAVDKHLPPWEPGPTSDVGAVGRVQTILNLKADRDEAARLREALERIESGGYTGYEAAEIAGKALAGGGQ